MSETRQITLSANNGGTITYNIQDHDPGKGLGLDDIERVISNLHKTDAYNNNVANDLGNAGSSDGIRVHC